MQNRAEPSDPIRILIADDHLAVREGLAAILNPRVGVQVVAQARDGQEAVDLFRQYRPNITLMDLRMPRMDGLTAIQTILADYPEARIIVLTAFVGEEENSLRAGAKAVVLKDAPREELLRAIYGQVEQTLNATGETDRPISHVAIDTLTQMNVDTICNALADLGEAMVVADINGNVLFLNPMAERLTGWSQAEAQGQDIGRIYNAVEEESGQNVQQLLLDIAQGGDLPATRVEMLLTSKGGGRLPIQDSAAAIQNPAGETIGVVVLFHDASQQRADRLRLEALNERLQHAMLETNHRVKNHLQAVAALIEVYQEEEEGGISPRAAQILSLHIRTLAQIHEFLHHGAPLKETDADFALVSARATLEKLILMVQTTTERLLLFRAEEIRLPARQCATLALIANELISNALEHGKGEVGVTLAREESAVTLEVSDNGPGFPEGFDMQRDFHTGLAVIERSARTDLGGELHYANRPDGGARVTVRFPSEGSPHWHYTPP